MRRKERAETTCEVEEDRSRRRLDRQRGMQEGRRRGGIDLVPPI